MITIKEIAAEAGVSVMTVSNVINNNHSRVSAATEQRVREIMKKHNYVPNMAARSLISKASHIITVLLPIWYETPDSLLLDPYVGQVTGMLESLRRERQYYVMICSFRKADEVLEMQRTWQTDGSILVVPHEDSITWELVKKSEAPLVVLDRFFEDLPMLSVCMDDRKGAYQATRYLLEKGHRQIGFASPKISTSTVLQDRYAGYLDAMGEWGLEANPAWLFQDAVHLEGGEAIGRRIAAMQQRPTAMITTEDTIACGIIKACQAEGMNVPQELSVVGFDDSLPARLLSPALTTMGQDARAKAQKAVDMLLEAIADKSVRNQRQVMDFALVERQSVAQQ